MPGIPSISQRTIAFLFICLLSSIVLLSSDAGPPQIAISQIPALEDGMKIRVSGLLVDEWISESGAESFVLAEPVDASTVRIVSSPGARPQPSRYANLGDELQVIGELSKSGHAPTIFASSDDISVQRKSDQVLTVDILLSNWILFEGDCVGVKGLLSTDSLGASPRLFGHGMNCSVALDPGGFEVDELMGSTVAVTGIVHFEYRTSALVLIVRSIRAEG